MIKINLTQDFPIEVKQSYDCVYIELMRPQLAGIRLTTTEARQLAAVLEVVAKEADLVSGKNK